MQTLRTACSPVRDDQTCVERQSVGRKPLLKLSRGRRTSSTSRESTTALACFVFSTNTNSRVGLFASFSRHQASSCENSMHWQCERPCEIATHARLTPRRHKHSWTNLWQRRPAYASALTPQTGANSTNNKKRPICMTSFKPAPRQAAFD